MATAEATTRCCWRCCAISVTVSPPLITRMFASCCVTRNRFGEDEYFVHWTEKSPPSDYVLIGSYEPTEEERAIDSMGSYGPHWSLEAVYWQSDSARARAEPEVGAGTATEPSAVVRVAPGARNPTRGSTLDATTFWQLISALSLDEPDEDRSLRAAVRRLSRRSCADIIEFEEMMAEALHRLDTQEHAASAGAAGSSGDAFLYARCYVLARGRAFYEDVLANPTRFPKDGDFERLLTIASAAFEAKTGRAFEHDAQFSYETGSNQTGWE